MFQHQLTVRFNECDGLGHVNNATYFTYLEDARTPIFQLFNPSLALESWNLIVASARCDFLAQVNYAESLTVFTWIGKLGNSSFTLEQAIQNARGEWVARGQAALISFDYTVQKAAAIPDDVRSVLSTHTEAPEGVPTLRG